jgi:pSer/pThr/pTyr-binding forkhead associated (FHA) protein
MHNVPVIVVQIVHILGPLKGQIQEFSEPEIRIGRKSSCHIQFPKDLNIISREHARIVREGNRFKLIDQSANGTFLNGKPVSETYLKNGDVLMFAEGGPKVSFLTMMLDATSDIEQIRPALEPPPSAAAPPRTPPRPVAPPPAEVGDPVGRTQVPLVIQYGPTLRSFKELPVTIGRGAACQFVISHPGLQDQQVQIYFNREQYWVKDLTGKQMVRVNGRPISVQHPLAANDRLALSPSGPVFRFLGAGRLAEIEAPDLSPRDAAPAAPPAPAGKPASEKPSGKPAHGESLFKKLFSR